MNKVLLAILSLLLVAACDAHPGGRGTEPTQKAKLDRASPIIAVSGSEIRINGTSVWLGDTIASWKKVLGGSPTCYDEGLIVICVWHSNGFSLGTDQIDKTRVKFMLIDLTIEPPDFEESSPSSPQFPFQGILELDSIPIYADTEFRYLLRHVPVARELRCGGSDCGNPIAAFSDGANIHISLAGRSEKSHVLSFSISCSRTQTCTKLIPGNEKR